MKFLGGFRALLVLLTLQIGLVGCKRTEPEPMPESALEEPTPAPTATATPAPTPTATPAPATTTEAAPKNFHLKRRISVTHDAGIIGIPAGTIVTIIEQKGDRLLVSANGMKVEVAATDITQNPEEIPTFMPPAPSAPGNPASGGPSTQVKATPPSPRATPDVRAAQRAAKNQKIYQLRQEIARLSARRRELYDQLSQMRNPDRTPEGKARKAEVRQIGLTIDQLFIEIRQLSH